MSHKNRNKHAIVTTQQAELGQAFVARADENLRRTNQEQFQKVVDEVLRQIQEAENTARIARAAIRHFTARKNALQRGEFTFHPFRREIIYNDTRLNGNYQDNAENFQ